MGMILVDQCKYFNCPFDETTDTGHTNNISYNANYNMMIIIMWILFISSQCKTNPIQRDP